MSIDGLKGGVISEPLSGQRVGAVLGSVSQVPGPDHRDCTDCEDSENDDYLARVHLAGTIAGNLACKASCKAFARAGSSALRSTFQACDSLSGRSSPLPVSR